MECPVWLKNLKWESTLVTDFYSSEVNLHLYFYLRRSRIMLHPGFPKML